MIDPRSPTNEYNRTPIHCQTGGKTVNENLNSSLFNDSISSNANSSFDSSLHMQQGMIDILLVKLYSHSKLRIYI